MKMYDTFTMDSLKPFRVNKQIPSRYEKVILIALAHFPELKHVEIDFVLKKYHNRPLSAECPIGAFLQFRHKKKFNVIIREEAEYPQVHMLLKILPPEVQIGAIARELALICIMRTRSYFSLLKTRLTEADIPLNSEMETEVDNVVIEHGLATQLFEYANYMKTIPVLPLEVHKPVLRPEAILLLHNQRLGL